jgi:flavin-dependent dehydrogenase
LTPPIVVLGAGPSGSTAARLLASWGHDVVLLARRVGDDHERTLAESLPPSCVALLERVGFTGLSTGGFLPSTGNTVYWGSDGKRVERFAEGRSGYQVERARFDEWLIRQVVEAGVDVRVGGTITSVVHGETGPTIDVSGRPSGIEASWVLDCTGRAGILARQWGRVGEPAAWTMAIIGVWESDAWPTADSSHTIVESTQYGWSWSVPVSERRRYVTMMVDPALTRLEGRALLDRTYARQLERTQHLNALVMKARLVGPVFARDATPYSARTYGKRGALLVGDAGSFVDPLSSFGIKKAVASAWLASVVVHSILLNDSIAEPALELFNARERSMYDALRRVTGALARDAAAASPGEFWASRAMAATTDPETSSEPDAAALREDPDVLRSFTELRERDVLRLRVSERIQRSRRPTVRGNRVVVEDHLVVPAFPEGVRYIRNVDLLRLSELAVAYQQVPDLFEAYNRSASPVALPDFLGALSVLVAKGFLEWS